MTAMSQQFPTPKVPIRRVCLCEPDWLPIFHGATDADARAPIDSFLTAQLVKILVGPQRKEYVVHKDLLCDRSAYFSGAFKSDFKEGREGTLTLPDDDCDAFGKLIGWIYGGRVPVPSNHPALKVLLRLYIMADRYLLKQLMNDTMDRIRAYYRMVMVICGEDIEYVCDNSAAGSQLRNFIVQYAAYETYNVAIDKDPELDKDHEDDSFVHEEYLTVVEKSGDVARDFLRAFSRMSHYDFKDPADWDVDNYHVTVKPAEGKPAAGSANAGHASCN